MSIIVVSSPGHPGTQLRANLNTGFVFGRLIRLGFIDLIRILARCCIKQISDTKTFK